MGTIFLGVLGAIGAALVSLALWRRQLIEKRRYEVAEQILYAAIEAVSVLEFVRSPLGYVGEGKTRQRGERETDDEARHLDRLFTPFERMNKHQGTLQALGKAAITCEAHFGPAAAKPFDELQAACNEVRLAAAERFDSRDGLEGEENRRIMRVLYRGQSVDPIGDRANAALAAIKDQCAKELRPGPLAILLFIRPEHIERARVSARKLFSKF